METFTLNAGNTIAGVPLATTAYRLGDGRGPKTYIQGGLHGGEISYGAFVEMIKVLQKETLKGTITLVPIANPISWQQRLYYWTAGKFSFTTGIDFNWVYPGKKDGSLEERLAYMVCQEARRNDFTIDLHTANWCQPYGYMFSKDDVAIGKIGGFKLARLRDGFADLKAAGVNTFSTAMIEEGIPSIAFELGGHNTFNEAHNRRTADAVLDILAHRGHIKRKSETYNKGEYYFTRSKIYYAPTSGFVEYTVPFETAVKQGDILYRLYDAADPRRTIDVRAQEDGVMFLRARSHIAEVGDYVVEIIPTSELHTY